MLSLKVTSKLKGQMSLLRNAMVGASHRNSICCHTFQNFINANFNTFFAVAIASDIAPDFIAAAVAAAAVDWT